MLALYRSGRQAEALALPGGRELLSRSSGSSRARSCAAGGGDPRPGPCARRVQRSACAPLPAPATPLVGRVPELEELGELLGPAARLITLVGPGGVGKTRLALPPPSGSFRRRFLRPALRGAGSGRAREIARTPSASTRRRRSADWPGHRLLLVLDNFEQLLDAAPVVAAAARRRARPAGAGDEPRSAEPPRRARVRGRPARARRRGRAVLCPRPRPRPPFRPDRRADRVAARLERLPLAIELVASRAGRLTRRRWRPVWRCSSWRRRAA